MCFAHSKNNMCTHPITIKNPNFGASGAGINYLKNCTNRYIQVPCRQCSQCFSMLQSFYNQRVQMESLRSHLFMMTLTYNTRSLMYTDISDYILAYPYWPDVQNMFKRLRRDGHKLRYAFVSEYGSLRHRPHFHAIIAIDKSLGDPYSLEHTYKKLFLLEWRRNYGSTRSPVYDRLCDYRRVFKNGRIHTNYDFHYIESVAGHDSDVSFYVSKYLTKFDKRIKSLLSKISLDKSLSFEEQDFLIRCIKPSSHMSKDFGDKHFKPISDYIKNNLKFYDDLPQFTDLHTGKPFLLSPYYSSLIPRSFYETRMKYSSLVDSYLILDDSDLYSINATIQSNICQDDALRHKLTSIYDSHLSFDDIF